MIELNEVRYGYDGTALLSDISLKLSPGSFHFLTGPSGAGKTTLMKLCYLELTPSGGSVTVYGRPARELGRDEVADLRQRVGVVHQNCQFLEHRSLRDNIALPLAVTGAQVADFAHEIDELLAWVGLGPRADALPAELSGGERQRAALARALILSPDVILADEPTGNVDWEMSQRLLTLLVELNRMGKSVLIATHDLNLIRLAKKQVSGRVLRLKDGRLDMAGAEL